MKKGGGVPGKLWKESRPESHMRKAPRHGEIPIKVKKKVGEGSEREKSGKPRAL